MHVHRCESARDEMMKQSAFSLACLRAHADELVAAVHGSNDVIVITDSGSPKAVLQDIHSFQSLHRTISLLENLVAEHADVLAPNRAEIDSVLGQLHIIN